ncbi:MAG: hypothetical protein A3F46_04465 [Legionellales bacterium RIFCSPHIGHO2_12_FULL_42_9]|nr:MAG: hypothetical protein A3F46_04465 [Legionellales bacterium RIFCSPHIGHO2_12_FULL_42_9]
MLSFLTTFLFFGRYLQGRVETYAMLFDGSLTGLDRTSPITYRGVKVGEVSRIELTATKTKSKIAIPVYVEFFIEKSFVQQDNPIEILIENGVVATISAPNIFTGTASIQLVPGHGKKRHLLSNTFHGYSTFPTESSTEQNETNLNNTLQTAQQAFEDISKFVKSKEFKDTLNTIKDTADSIDKLATTLDNQVPGVLLYFSDSLSEFKRAAYSARSLTDYLARHPEALLRGKKL